MNIETSYKGCWFRSRLEARWAVIFDAIGAQWEYEEEGFDLPSGRYLPDFWISIQHSQFPNAGYWVEVKPKQLGSDSLVQACRLMGELTKSTKHSSIIVAGDPGDFWMIGCHRNRDGYGMSNRDSHDWLIPSRRAEFYALCLALRITDSRSFGDVGEAIRAARSARFEHGETPTGRNR